jgi:hypothetical protein
MGGPRAAVGELAVSDRESMTLGAWVHRQFKRMNGGQLAIGLSGLGLLALRALSSHLAFAHASKFVSTAVLPTGVKSPQAPAVSNSQAPL